MAGKESRLRFLTLARSAVNQWEREPPESSDMPSLLNRSSLMFRSLLVMFLSSAALAMAQQPLPATSLPIGESITPVFVGAQGPCDAVTGEAYSNYRLVLDYDAAEGADAKIVLLGQHEVALPTGKGRKIEIACEHLKTRSARIRVWEGGNLVEPGRDLPGTASVAGGMVAGKKESDEVLRLDGDFTAMVRFQAGADGTLIAKAMPEGAWVPNGKAFFLRGGMPVYDIGWKGAVTGKGPLKDGVDYVTVLVAEKGGVRMFINGELQVERASFSTPDPEGAVFKIGSAAEDFGGTFGGRLANVRFWKRALNEHEIASLSNGDADTVNTPDLNWKPDKPSAAMPEKSYGAVPGLAEKIALKAGQGFSVNHAFVQPLALADHAELVAGWDEQSFHRGEEIYTQLCVTCHGTLDSPGSLPTATRFHAGPFRNGADPYRMYQTLEKGYGMMVAQPQYTTAQKYDVIHYIRKAFLEGRNDKQLTTIDEEYLELLPRGMALRQEEAKPVNLPEYMQQDYGDVLFWTLQVEEGNIAQKGITVRMDAGPGGVAKGNAWMLYDHDTMRLAACWTGSEFIDWKGIAFDGSHGSHTRIVGEKHFVSPDEPMWANPATGNFEDLRIKGRDGRPYGPLPRKWVHFKGLELHAGGPVLRYTVGDCEIREMPRKTPGELAFYRVFHCGPSSKPLKLRIGGGKVHTIPASRKPFKFSLCYRDGEVRVIPDSEIPAAPGAPASKRFTGTLRSDIQTGEGDGPFVVDVFNPPAPKTDPWRSWMRTTGFDFFEDGRSAAVCTWNGDVWIVDGIDQSSGELTWQRVCSGLFQPLGLKILNGEIYVGCRDMIAVLRDLNGDRETDSIESFNSDHQVTEHFHEFAMGLQADRDGNFYYAKSARHAMTAVVPHHGTLLKVSKDGFATTILATGFRAANGVCINPDGSFMVTDQEGNWNPKNRINWVKGKGPKEFYGNMWGYHDVTDESDSAMIQPLCWTTNHFDRSPGELLWVPQDSPWQSLRGALLNLSYGEGKIFIVPHEKTGTGVQGGMSPLPVDTFPTGVMRGRFHPRDGQLYACGMYAWAGNRQQPGGFYRVRYTGKPCWVPSGLETSGKTLKISLTDPVQKDSARDPGSWKIRAWDLQRSSGYGSQHLNERDLQVTKVDLSTDGKVITLTVPNLAPTWGMSIQMKLKGLNGEMVEREIHNSIFKLQ
jgi:mono/diheme cytochrome c family protein